MASLILIFVNLFRRNRVITVRRMPPRKVLRAHLLGITFAVFAVFLISILLLTDATTLGGVSLSRLSWYTLPLIVIAYALGSMIGGLFIIVVALFALYLNPAGEPLWILIKTLSIGYSWSYLFGAVFGTLYNDLVFLYLIVFRQDQVKIVFKFDPPKPFNIIKSPVESEVTVPVDRERRLYDYELDKPPAHPYTIAFVANPWVLKLKDPNLRSVGDIFKPQNYDDDPMIRNLDLFLGSIERALGSLEADEVLGRPEIWSRVRVIALFDPRLANPQEKLKNLNSELSNSIYGMAQPYPEALKIDGTATDNLLSPLDNPPDVAGGASLKSRYRLMLEAAGLSAEEADKYESETDVIYILSAAPLYDRCTANFSDWLHDELEADPAPMREGRKFKFNLDPGGAKNGEINNETCQPPPQNPGDFVPPFICLHDYYSEKPGLVALNVIGASNKTFIHEFGHAMSAAFRGAITDEYADRFEVEKEDDGNNGNGNGNDTAPFYANRIERPKKDDGTVVPVHKVFAKYNISEHGDSNTIFYSDLDHSSAEERWLGYFPDRKDPNAVCTMDRNYSLYRFDELLSNFIYDRLITKINRSDKPGNGGNGS